MGYFDVKVFSPLAKLYLRKKLNSLLNTAKASKKTLYIVIYLNEIEVMDQVVSIRDDR